MGYHISIWDGETPNDVEHAHKIWSRIYREAHPRVPPSTRMSAFVQLLEQEWPGAIADDTPWKYAPLAQDAAGNLFDTALRWGADDAAARICALAEREGLVFFDPQHPDLRGRFRPRWEQ